MKPVKPKIVSKDNSSPSAKEQIKLTKYGKVELTPLAKKLMVFAKEDKSVLLYGDYASDLYVFMNKFHKEMNDKNPLFKYVGKENMPEDFNPDEYLATEMRKAIENRKHKKIYELFRDFKRTENTYLHIDCQNDDGETVLKKLTGVENFTKNEVLERISSMMKHNENWETFYADIVDYKGHLREKRSSTNYFCEPYSLSTSYCRRRLLAREGTLFVENLICEQDNPKDKASYERLAAQIKKDKYEGEDEGVWSISLSGWLVVCAYDFTTFPQRFLDQFVMVPLDDSEAKQQNKEINKEGVVVGPDAKVEEAKDITKGKLIDKIPSGTKWTEIEMSLVDKEYKTLDISIRGGKSFTVNPREIGLESNHTHKPLKAWWVLMAFAQSENGEIPSTGEALRDFAVSNYEMVPKEGKALFDHIDKLRKALSINFGISDDPVPHSADKEAYETLFRIKDTSYTEEHKKSSQNIEGAKCNECGEVIKKLDHNNLDEEGNYICDKCKGASYDRLSKGGTYGEYPGEDE